MVQHALNRSNGRMQLSHKPGDHDAFVNLLADAGERVPGVQIDRVLLDSQPSAPGPRADGELSAFLDWLNYTNVRRWRQHRHSVGQGHVYQRRFTSFPVQDDAHYLTPLRYVEANARRAKLVTRAEHWRWSSLRGPDTPDGRPLLCAGPLTRPVDWHQIVNEPLGAGARAAARASIRRGRPFGDDAWVRTTAARLGLAFTLRPRGRPTTNSTGEGTPMTDVPFHAI